MLEHRMFVGPWQSSITIKPGQNSLGQRFRVAGYPLNCRWLGDSSGFDYVAVYAPFDGTLVSKQLAALHAVPLH